MGTERRENRKWAPTIESGVFLTQNISRKSKLSAMRDVKFTEISEVSESWFKFLRMVFPLFKGKNKERRHRMKIVSINT